MYVLFSDNSIKTTRCSESNNVFLPRRPIIHALSEMSAAVGLQLNTPRPYVNMTFFFLRIFKNFFFFIYTRIFLTIGEFVFKVDLGESASAEPRVYHSCFGIFWVIVVYYPRLPQYTSGKWKKCRFC